MRIEKISDTQVKFTLSNTDLEERNIKINDLAHGSEKTHMLFQEMMRQAHTECNFESENTPLMVEAMPVGKSHVVIVVTKIADAVEEERALNLFPKAHGNELFKTHCLQEPEPEVLRKESIAIFSFGQLDDATFAAKRLHDYFMGQSRLYKCTNNVGRTAARYFLVIQDEIAYSLIEAETVLHEYGEKHVSNSLSENYLKEHGELLIANQAVEKLAWYL